MANIQDITSLIRENTFSSNLSTNGGKMTELMWETTEGDHTKERDLAIAFCKIGENYCPLNNLKLDNTKRDFTDIYKNIQVQTLTHLISYHNKQKLLSEEIKSILSLTKNDINLIISNHSLLLLKSININIDEKLKKIVVNNTKTAWVLQSKINEQLYNFLLSSYSNVKDKNITSSLLIESINFLVKMK